MVKQVKITLGMGAIFLTVVVVITALAAIVAPTFAAPPEIGLKKHTITPAPIIDIIEREPIESIRVVDAGNTTWCDAFVAVPGQDPIREVMEVMAMSTDDPMIQAFLVAAQVSKTKVTVRGYKIFKPADRAWSSKVVLFYKITEVEADPFYMLYSP